MTLVVDGIVQSRLGTGPATAIEPHANSTTRRITNNKGFVTENSGTATLPTAGAVTEIDVAHGLDVTPSAGDIMITPIETWGNITKFWISAYDGTNFTITVDAAPGQDVDFAWKAVVL